MRLPSAIWLRVLLWVLVGLLLCLGISWRQRGEAHLPQLPLPQDPLIQVYFNHSQASLYREPYRQQERLGDDLEQVIVEAIGAAQVSVDVAVQELRLPQIAAALQQRQQAGVKVRVILENTYNHPFSSVSSQEAEQLEERDRNRYQEGIQLIDTNHDGLLAADEIAQNDALVVLQTAQVPILDDTADGSKGSDLMHHKFIVVDGQRLLLGSANFTTSDIHGDFAAPETQGNANHLVQIQSPAVAQLFTDEFNLMWGDGPGKLTDSQFGLQKPYRPARSIQLAAGSRVTVQFSPTSSARTWDESVNGLIGRSLAVATRQIDLALFVFSDQALSNGLEALHQRGVQVRALIESGFAFRSYSEALDMLGVAMPDQKCRLELGNQPWRRAIASVGTPTLPEGDLLHHKFAIIDAMRVVTGSQNWSAAANHSNDEDLLVIDNPTVASHFQREFERLYATAALGVPTWLQQKARQENARCRSAHGLPFTP